MRKALLLVLAAVLAMIALPAVSADAVPADGNFAGCYTVREHSKRYNDVLAGAKVTASGSQLRVHGVVAVSKACQKTNTIPIHRVTILHARLRNDRTGKVVRLSGDSTTTTKAIVRSTTDPKFAPCHVGFTASIQLSYSYTDGTSVRPFWIHGKKFVRC